MKMKKIREKLIIFFLGLFIILFLLEIGLWIVGNVYLRQIPSNKEPLLDDKTRQYTILCIGDSFTEGIGALPKENYPSHLEALFNSRYKKPIVRVINSGVGGKNTAQLIDILKDDLEMIKPNIVVFLAGVQNIWNYHYIERQNLFFKLKERLYHLHIYKLAKLFHFYIRKKNVDELSENMFSFSEANTYKELEDKIRKIEKNLEKIIDIQHNISKNYFKLEKFYNSLSRGTDATVYLEKALGWRMRYIEARLDLGNFYLEGRKDNKAMKIFKDVLKEKLSREDIYNKLKGFYREEEPLRMMMERIDMIKVSACLELGMCYRNKSKYKEAEEVYRKALDIVPEHEKEIVYNGLGLCCEEQEKYDEAIEWYKKVIKLSPYGNNYYYNVGNIVLKQKKYEEALKWFRKATEINHRNNMCHRIGEALLEDGKYKEAIGWFEFTANFPTGNCSYYDDISILISDLKIYEYAIKEFEQAIKEDYDNYNLYYGLGMVYFRRQQYQEAIEWFKKAARLNSDKLILYDKIATAFEIDGKLLKALKWFKMGIKKCKGNLTDRGYCDSICRIYQRLDMRDEAIEFFSKLSKTHPEALNFLRVLKLEDKFAVKKEIRKWIISDVKELIKLCKGIEAKVILQSYPVVKGRNELEVSDILRNFARKHSILFVDQHLLFRNMIKDRKDLNIFHSPDGHCNGEGYYIMAKNLYNAIVKEELININGKRDYENGKK